MFRAAISQLLISVSATRVVLERAGVDSDTLVPTLIFAGTRNFFMSVTGDELDIYCECSFVLLSLEIRISKLCSSNLVPILDSEFIMFLACHLTMIMDATHRLSYAVPRTKDADLLFRAFPKVQFMEGGDLILELYG